MPELKLYSFSVGDRVLVSRLVLAAANADYEFVLVDKSKWPDLKPTFAFGQLPVLEINGKRYGQSLAIQAYLAREYGLYGSNNIEQLEIDQIIQLKEDFTREAFQRGRDVDPDKKVEREKHLNENVLPRYLGFFSKILQENGTGYAVGDKLSLADFVLFDATTSQLRKNADLLQKYPKILAHKEKVGQVPGIKEYLASIAETTRF